MSKAADGQRIVCDGEGCTACARQPIELRPSFVVDQNKRDSVDGWLFVTRGRTERHYYPACAARYLGGTEDDTA
jgi:hypothetical protein